MTNLYGKENLTMLTDFYEITMANGFFENGRRDQTVYFDMFFRRVPDKGGYAIMAGLEQLIEYMNDLHFDEDDIGKNVFFTYEEAEKKRVERFGR